jgi:nitrate reductase gamma subunit
MSFNLIVPSQVLNTVIGIVTTIVLAGMGVFLLYRAWYSWTIFRDNLLKYTATSICLVAGVTCIFGALLLSGIVTLNII